MADRCEVELKFRISERNAIEMQLQQRGAVEQAGVSHRDAYFNHPTRDFRTTDEAFRIRSVGNENWMTYKGAVIGTTAKSRHEIEIGFAAGPDTAGQFAEMVKLLGFRFVREVCKSRSTWVLDAQGTTFELAIDHVPELGTFLEIELITDSDQREAAEREVWGLAHSMGLSVAEPRSYLDLLIESDGVSLQKSP